MGRGRGRGTGRGRGRGRSGEREGEAWFYMQGSDCTTPRHGNKANCTEERFLLLV